MPSLNPNHLGHMFKATLDSCFLVGNSKQEYRNSIAENTFGLRDFSVHFDKEWSLIAPLTSRPILPKKVKGHQIVSLPGPNICNTTNPLCAASAHYF